MESYEQCRQGRSYCSLIHRLFFVTRLIINKINKVQLVDFKLENVLVSLHSLKTMGLASFRASAPLVLRNGELLGHSPIHNIPWFYVFHYSACNKEEETAPRTGFFHNFQKREVVVRKWNKQLEGNFISTHVVMYCNLFRSKPCVRVQY